MSRVNTIWLCLTLDMALNDHISHDILVHHKSQSNQTVKSVFHKSPILLVLIFAGTHGQSEKYLLFNRRSFFLSQLESQFWHFQLGRPHQMCLWGDHYHIFTVLHGFHVDITKFAIHPLDSSALPTGLLSFPGFSSWKGEAFQFQSFDRTCPHRQV